MSKFENWTKTGITGAENSSPLNPGAHEQFKEYQQENHLHWIFLATRSGITAYWKMYHLANEEHIRWVTQPLHQPSSHSFLRQTIWRCESEFDRIELLRKNRQCYLYVRGRSYWRRSSHLFTLLRHLEFGNDERTWVDTEWFLDFTQCDRPAKAHSLLCRLRTEN